MPTKYLFADESGNFDFSRRPGATKHFAVGTTFVSTESLRSSIDALLGALRYQLVGRGITIEGAFHATTDKQPVRDAVYDVLKGLDLRVDTTVLEKSKAQPHLRATDDRFYQYAWHFHFKYLAGRLFSPGDHLVVVAASLGTKKKRREFKAAVDSVIAQHCPYTVTRDVVALSDESDYGLQVADYMLWAVMRDLERGDSRSLDLIRHQVRSTFDVFALGTTHHY